MDLDEAITICRLDLDDTRYYMMIGWLAKSFELYLYSQNKVWTGKFSANRLAGFSRNLHMTEESYYTSVKRCLSEQREDYHYELRDGFFYWKRNLRDYLVTEGFIPVELESSAKSSRPDLVEVLLALNKELRQKIKGLKNKYEEVKLDYERCLNDTEEFLNLKIDMEKALCDKFLNTLHSKKINVVAVDRKMEKIEDNSKKVSIKLANEESVIDTSSLFTLPEDLSTASNKLLEVDNLSAMDKFLVVNSGKWVV